MLCEGCEVRGKGYRKAGKQRGERGVKQWHEKGQKWCDCVQRLPEELVLIHVFKESPPATILSRVGY